MVATQIFYDDVSSSSSNTVADIPDFYDDVDSTVSNAVGDILDDTEQISADAPVYPTQDTIDFTEQMSADAPQYPTQDTIDFTEQINSEITEPSFAPKAGGSNAAKMIDKGLLWP